MDISMDLSMDIHIHGNPGNLSRSAVTIGTKFCAVFGSRGC